MVLPLVLAGAAMAGGALLSKMASDDLAETAAGASEAQLAALRDIMAKVDAGWQTPDLDTTPLTPEEVRLLERFVPTVAQHTKEKAPQLLVGAGQQEYVRAQQEALRRLQAQSTGADDTQFAAQREMATTQAAQELAAQRANILKDQARRGLGGGGQDILAQMAAAGQAEQMARQESLQGASTADQRRREALQQYQALAGQMRGQAAQQESSNVDIINSFNQRAASRKQAYDEYVAKTKSAADLRNAEESQRIAETNAARRDAARARNQDLANRAAEVRANAGNEKLRTMAGMGQNIAGQQYAGTVDAARAQAGGTQALGSGLMQVGSVGVSKALDNYFKTDEETTKPKKDIT